MKQEKTNEKLAQTSNICSNTDTNTNSYIKPKRPKVPSRNKSDYPRKLELTKKRNFHTSTSNHSDLPFPENGSEFEPSNVQDLNKPTLGQKWEKNK